MPAIWAIVVGAGRGSRFGSARPKQYERLGDASLFRHALRSLVDHPRIAGVLPVIAAEHQALFEEAAAGLGVVPPVTGGASRQESVHRALEALADHAPAQVLIHDAARPLLSAALVERVCGGLEQAEAVCPVLPLRDTVKRLDARGVLAATMARDELRLAQTPQGFRWELVRDLHRRYAAREMSDDAALAETAGVAVHMVEGEARNIKITDPDDMRLAESYLGAGEVRTGSGFDVHPLIAGNGLRLAGVAFDVPLALDGHSDADVALHALTDALLGAIAEGDIGQLFPPSEAAWKDADSAVFVEEAARRVRARDARIVNVDLTLLCERPKIGPRCLEMRARIAGLLGIETDRVSVKATTTEGLGFVGRGEGIATQAQATLRLA